MAGCRGGGTADWQQTREQANGLYNDQQFDEALGLYERALTTADAAGRLTLRQDIIDCHLALGKPTEARQLLAVQISEAHDSGNRQAEAEATYTLGEQLYKAGDGEKGFGYMQEAVRLMEQALKDTEPADSYGPAMTLAYFHHGLMKWRCTDEAYPQAIAHSKAIEQTVMPLGDDAQARKYRRIALSTRAYIYMRTDSTALAEADYREWQKLLPCLNLAEERDICPYYIESGRYKEAIEIYSRYEQNILETQGRWSTMERLICRNLAEIYQQTGQTDSAYSRLMEAYEIRDTLYARQAVANAQELEAVYQNQQKQEQIGRLRLWVIVLGGLLAVLAVATLMVRIRRLRERKNRTIVKMAQQLPDSIENTSHENGLESGEPDALRFASFDRTVEQSRLYTQSDLSREMLAELMGVDRTAFSRIIQEQSGCKNLKDYLNQKRMRLAEELLRHHPDFTIEAVAGDCGLGLTTFKRLCKEKHGMSPSDYRKSLQQQ